MKRWQVLLGAGLIGVLSLLLVPLEVLAPVKMPALQLRVLAIIQPALLTAIAVLIGELTAKRIGLRAPLVDALIGGADPGAVLRSQILPAVIVGVVTAALLLGYAHTIGRQLLEGAGQHARLAGFDLPLLPKLLYGGITEELLTRWALVSLFAWIGWRLAGRPTTLPLAVIVTAVVASALLFGLGHLPLLFLIAPHASSGIVLTVLAANALPGMLFGFLYARYGLEAAMMAHALAHLLSTILG